MGKKKTKVIIELLSSLTSISSITAGTAVIAYESIFTRFDRPDYAITPGEYCYERVSNELQRMELSYPSSEGNLKGYYYHVDNAKGIVIVSHGLKSGGDDYIPIIKYFVKAGFAVFSYNNTGTYESDGDDTVGMCQAIIDLESTIKFIKNQMILSRLPIFLVGHSWGGYAAGSVLCVTKEISGCAIIASMNNGCNMMYDKAEQYVGKLANVPKPVFMTYQKLLFGDYVNYTCVQGINSTDIPVVIAHGVDDKTILFKDQSVISHKNEITNPNVRYYVGKGVHGDHVNIWHSKESACYQLEVASELKYLEFSKGRELSYDEKVEFYKTVNHKLYSAVNEELMALIVETFESALNK